MGSASSDPQSICNITVGLPEGQDAMDYNITDAPCSLMGDSYYVSWYPSPADGSASMTLLKYGLTPFSVPSCVPSLTHHCCVVRTRRFGVALSSAM